VYLNRKIINTLNVKPKYGAMQGIKNTIEWYDINGLI